MKKQYFSPKAEACSLDCETIIAQSPIKIDKNSSGTEQLSNKNRGEWGDVWSK